MSVSRACLQCRSAKTRCDLVRPTCGRCLRRGTICSGFPVDAGFVFRDENGAARRNSQRARRERGESSGATALYVLNTRREDQSSQNVVGTVDNALQQQYTWLNERALAQVPEPLKRDVETRAVERFFINWTLYPSNQGASPGHMHELPMLYLSATPDSVLWLAVRALAFAEMKSERAGNVTFYVKARQHYGAALNRTRMLIHDEEDLGNDDVLSAMLLIDNFELIYLGRTDPLGPHNEAIKHVLRSRGDGQLYHPTRFSLWRLAHYRLQFWQTLLREEPDADQIAWVRKLNMDRPDLHICADVLHMNILSALSKRLTQTIVDTETRRAAKLERMRQLAQEMQELTISIEKWTSEMTGAWKPKDDDPQNIAQPQHVNESPNFPIPHFLFPSLLSYDDVWVAYVWNFYAASQIILRESIVELIRYAAELQELDEPNADDTAIIQSQHDWVDTLSAAIIRTFPMLLGFTHKHERREVTQVAHQGKIAGRLFSLFSMWVIQQAQSTSVQHKQTASEVIAWVNSRHGLG